jgi:hypothetical protein
VPASDPFLRDQERIKETSNGQEDIQHAKFAKMLAETLISFLPTIFSPQVTKPEPAVLAYSGLDEDEIFVDEMEQL